MKAVAAQAGCSLAAVYKYFPDKASVIASLAQEQAQAGREIIATAVAGIDDKPALHAALEGLYEAWFARAEETPAAVAVTKALRGEPRLDALRQTLTEEMAHPLSAALGHVAQGGLDDKKADELALLIVMQMEAAVDLALSLKPGEAKRMMALAQTAIKGPLQKRGLW